ncbi:MAG: Ig-like domain-containing protein [Candidatus Poribacteria bacterium]|nr:Ig-like domain-containing protein [Candidatus Poribacteria bacterium]
MKKRTLVCFLIFTLCVFYTAIPNTVFGQEEEASLAEQVKEKYSELLGREDIAAVLPQALKGLKSDQVQNTLSGNPALINIVVDNPDILANFGVELDPEFITLLKEDEAVKAMLRDPLVQSVLANVDAIEEFEALLAAPPDPGTPDPGTPDPGTPDPGTPDPGTPDPGTPDPGTPDPGTPTPPPIVEPPDPEQPIVEPPKEDVKSASPFAPITPANQSIYGKSQLGGLSLNRFFGRQFLQGMISASNLEGHTVDTLVDLILNQVPSGLLSKKQLASIRYALTKESTSIFDNEADQLDFENFGNAITPKPVEIGYLDVPNAKYLTRDNLNLYVRVPLPATDVGGVTFMLQDGDGATGEHTADVSSGTISHTFQLDESLAATNLPAWPTSTTGLFSGVNLWYSHDRLEGYQMVPMMASADAAGGVVWETVVEGIPLGNNVYYYFEVTLFEAVELEILDRYQLLALSADPPKDSAELLGEIADATVPLEITSWSMPDPRNLQIVERGIVKALFTPNVNTAIDNFINLPAVQKIITGQDLTPQDRGEIGRGLNRLQGPLLLSANALLSEIQSTKDPMLASVFSVPTVDPASESLWVANIDAIADNNYYLAATVHDTAGAPLDQIQETFTVDTAAPEATIAFKPELNATGYWNSEEGVYVATAPAPGAAALNVRGMPEYAIDAGESYLVFQEAELDADGNFQNTWLPLTIESTMASSKILQAALSQNPALLRPYVGDSLTDEQILGLIGTVTPELILGTITPTLIQTEVNKALAQSGIAIQLNEYQSEVIHDILGTTFDLIDKLLPVSFEFVPGEGYAMTMPIQGDGMPLAIGDYGVRALGIDTLFNINANAPHARLRIVAPDYDKASVTAAVIGDCNMDGDMDDLFESGPIGDVTIFGNTTEDVMLTVTVDHRSAHPATVMVQYMDAAGAWQNIGELDLAGTEMGSTLTIPWNVADFDALIGAGSSVMVRAVATNALRLTDPEPTAGSINLDAGICPLDPEVIAITVDPATTTNSVSGAPQGMVTLNAYTPSRTSTDITSVRLAAKGPQDAEWTIETSEAAENIGGQALADLLGDLVNTVGPDKPSVNVGSTYQKWTISIDTTMLMDTITKGSTDDNQYVVTGYANTEGGEMPPIPGVEAKFSVDNIGPTNITAVATADGAVEANEDGSYTVGGLVDKYDDAVESPMATFTIKPVSYMGTYASVMVVTDAEGASIGEATETAEGSGVFEITVDVGILADGEYLENGTYMFHAVAVDAEGAEVAETEGAKISVNVENNYRPAPEILAITTDPAAETNPDSGAPKGIVTVNVYSIGEITSPLMTSTRIEAKRQNDDDSAWEPVGTAEEGIAVTAEEVQELQHLNVDSLSDLIAVAAGNAATSAEASPIHRYQTYQKWTVDIDTVALELPDTIDKDSPAARDASKDDNPYVVRAVAISAADEGETESPDGVQSTFSLDNVDDVGPLGPTNIVAVADVAGMIEANEDGSYTVGGIVDDTVPSPIAIFTAEPTADPMTYASANLVQATEDSAETVAEGEAGSLDLTIDVGLLENGTYMFHALAVDESGNVQTDESPMITVHVLNIRVSDITELAVIGVDDTDVPEPPAEPIPLRESVTVSFMVPNGSLAAEELSGAVNGAAMPSESAEDPENIFSLKVEVGSLADGVYTPDGVITKRNGSVAFPLTTVNVDNTGPMVTIESPMEDETVDSLPTIRSTYHDGAGAGVDGATGSLALARLQPPDEAEVVVDQADLDKDAASLVYTRSEPLAGGAYRVTVQVSDSLGNVGEGSAEFAVNGTAPMVAIHSPASGQTFEHGEPLISGEFAGAGTVEVTTFTINDVEATPEVDGNRFSYTPEEGLGDGNHMVVVAVTDGDGNTAQTSVTFTVKMPKDTTPPVISAAAPNGIIKDTDPDKLGAVVISAVVTDEQSAISSVKYSINGGVSRSVATLNVAEGEIQAPVDFETHGPGLYTVALSATSQGGTTKHVWTFTLILDNTAPTISSITPSGTFRGGLPVISASASDESGIAKITIAVMDAAGKEVKGKTADDGEDNVEGVTRLDFNPEAPLDEGTYTIEVRATDTLGNSATAKENFTIDFDTAAPVITMASPQNEARLTNRRPQISITYADAESGVDVDSIRFVFDDKLINLAPNQKSASQVMYTPPADLAFGQHTVKLEVSDMAHKEGNVSEKNKDARKANMAVYEFSFTVESEEGPVLASRPINAPNPFKENTRISFTLTRQSTLSIIIYDSTLRPVRVLVDNEVWGAGEYTGKAAIGWDGTSTSGEDLARGIYFCQIIVAESFEPEYVILKLALTR